MIKKILNAVLVLLLIGCGSSSSHSPITSSPESIPIAEESSPEQAEKEQLNLNITKVALGDRFYVRFLEDQNIYTLEAYNYSKAITKDIIDVSYRKASDQAWWDIKAGIQKLSKELYDELGPGYYLSLYDHANKGKFLVVFLDGELVFDAVEDR